MVEILDFIRSCIKRRRIHWTYHVNLRLEGRIIPRELILNSVDSYGIIEEYPDDKYLPSYLIYDSVDLSGIYKKEHFSAS